MGASSCFHVFPLCLPWSVSESQARSHISLPQSRLVAHSSLFLAQGSTLISERLFAIG